MNPLRQVDPTPTSRCSRCRRSKATARRSSISRTCFVGSDLTQVVGTMRNFIPERMVRATGRMMRMNIDDGDIFIGEFANGALCSIQTSFVTVGNYPGIEARVYGSKGALICRLVEEGGVCETPEGGDRRRRSSSASSTCPSAFYPPRRHVPRVVAHALLREPDQQLHRRDPRASDETNEGDFGDGAWVQEVDQRRRAVVPRAPLGVAPAARHDVAPPLARRGVGKEGDRSSASLEDSYYRLRPVNATFTGVHEHDRIGCPTGRPTACRRRRRDAFAADLARGAADRPIADRPGLARSGAGDLVPRHADRRARRTALSARQSIARRRRSDLRRDRR